MAEIYINSVSSTAYNITLAKSSDILYLLRSYLSAGIELNASVIICVRSIFDCIVGMFVSNKKVYIARHGGCRVGFMQTNIKSDHTAVMYVYVDPAFRRMGIGKAFMKKAECISINNGAAVWLSSKNDNISAHEFYRHNGFTPVVGKKYTKFIKASSR
ncbi:UNVERIFIED_ORG: ribosomal protein S18 acetylase RimI-like enzyme [Methylobacterium sp. SuP10 SLI 274]|uniref:GNAT family N-acetyltransferase n=1 Tax=Methylorubrum extorquens TaxID=408 RepID=UPI0020A1A099|nr:GNAT family N-acetyltransferase [Methylorubrum extorquens]MDF9866445.1 ribosomal protein S18 acetylase RimI-like enzyme [Methylorubrum pseudosasae]MDH6639954.1 ribosomal protein S18 acetylase RimI-like enzyme [Methylobacterium sp. SuP10 SLI 274]MDH6669322.1 ribosomal protein S18 acetylase RimI-like enzyme [Methylorubrum zatmanii]MCP1561939.1 ribosomal protein S18 acetylase RimI-like enzyme [Methylorubrum extorquens]MDF9794716.1 ribosomal protein S18 acetylase RimI-like enzyme [Methylorubrum